MGLWGPERGRGRVRRRRRRLTEAAKAERPAVEADLRGVESTGLGFVLEEHSRGICAIGAAFRDSLGREFSLSIPVPAARFAGKRQQLSKLLKKARADLLAGLNVFALPLS